MLPDGIGAGKGGLGFLNGGIVEMGDQTVGGLPRLFSGFAHNHMQADPEAHLTTVSRGFSAHLFDLLFDQLRRLAPGEIEIHLLGGQILSDVR